MSFNNDDRHSCIYRLENERNALKQNTYFADVVPYKPGLPPQCEDTPGESNPENLAYECNSERYVQVALFNKQYEDGNQYFMIVNRRCSPYKDETNEDTGGVRRYISISFDVDAQEFNGYDLWQIRDLGNDTIPPIQFNTIYNRLINLGWFLPGEGKLYKIEPYE